MGEADRGNRGIEIDGKMENCEDCAFLREPYADRPAHCGKTGSNIEITKVCLEGRFIREPRNVEEIEELVRGLLQKRRGLLAAKSQDMSPVATETLAS